MKNHKKGFLVVAVCYGIVIGLVANMFVGRLFAKDETFEYIDVFWEAITHVQDEYVKETKPQELIHAALTGMMRSLDRHSEFLPPTRYTELEEETEGEFGGLGIVISPSITVLAVIPDSPAKRAGLEAGDIIAEINGEPAKDMTQSQAAEKMKGKKGTEVSLTVTRKKDDGSEEKLSYSIQRDTIPMFTIVDEKMLDPDIGYIRLKDFKKHSGAEVEKAVKELQSRGMKGLVLDLRFNPGGLLDASVDVAERFLPKNRQVVYTRGRQPNQDENRLSRTGDMAPDLPITLLVNRWSASASEIVAGALKDWDRATVIGRRTYGKGSVQAVIPLSDSSALRMTTANFYTPKAPAEMPIEVNGVEPHENVPLGPDDVSDLSTERVLAEKEKELKTPKQKEEEDTDEVEPPSQTPAASPGPSPATLPPGHPDYVGYYNKDEQKLSLKMVREEIWYLNGVSENPEAQGKIDKLLYPQDKPEETFDDPQLKRAIEILQEKIPYKGKLMVEEKPIETDVLVTSNA